MIIQELSQEKEKMLAIARKVDKRLSKAPEGNIRIIKHRNGYQFYLRMNGADKSGVYLPVSERNKALALIQKGYDLKVKAAAQKQYHALDHFLKHYEPDVLKNIYAAMPEIRSRNITPVEISDREYIRQWEAYEYEPKGFPEDYPEHYTGKGERVRSKSEVMIADILSQENIPYRYECPLHLGKTVIHPDFTILRAGDRETLYWEHLGMMDDPEYTGNALKRIRLYEKYGLYPGVRLILTMENAAFPLNSSVIRHMIQVYCI